MTADRETSWAELEARAQRLLEHAKELEPREPIRRYGSLLRLWHFPAYGPQMTWTILTPGRKAAPDAPPMAREIAWDRQADQARLFDSPEGAPLHPSPSLRLRDASLPTAELRQRLEEGTHLAVPVIVHSQTVGLDGEYFGLETYEVSPNVRLQWWKDGPTEWRHFLDWVGGLRSFVMRHLDQPG